MQLGQFTEEHDSNSQYSFGYIRMACSIYIVNAKKTFYLKIPHFLASQGDELRAQKGLERLRDRGAMLPCLSKEDFALPRTNITVIKEKIKRMLSLRTLLAKKGGDGVARIQVNPADIL